VELVLDSGERVHLLPEEVLVSLRKREGFAAAQSNGTTVVLDTTLTPELIEEGIARDFVRSIQDLRKQLELRIEDTITLQFSSDDDIGRAIETHLLYVKREVLATEVERLSPEEIADRGASVKVGNSDVRISITPHGKPE
jgi:isoleucyl-tRNA synthetase